MSSTETKNRQAGEKKAVILLLNSSSRPLDLIRKRHLGYELELNSKDEKGRNRLIHSRLN